MRRSLKRSESGTGEKQMEKKSPGGTKPVASDAEALVPVTHSTN